MVPTFFADVEYRDITAEGLLRQTPFKHLSKREPEGIFIVSLA